MEEETLIEKTRRHRTRAVSLARRYGLIR